MSGTVLQTLYVLIFPVALGSRYYYLHFINEETEARGINNLKYVAEPAFEAKHLVPHTNKPKSLQDFIRVTSP